MEQISYRSGIWGWYWLAIKNSLVIEGRAGKKEFWNFFLVDILLFSFFLILDLLFNTGLRMEILGYTFYVYPLVVSYFLIIFVPRLTVIMRRLHDVNHTGGWIFLPFLLMALSFVCGNRVSNIKERITPELYYVLKKWGFIPEVFNWEGFYFLVHIGTMLAAVICLFVTVIFLAGTGSKRKNLFGEPPTLTDEEVKDDKPVFTRYR